MRIISQREIKKQLNNCYEAWDPNWEHNIGNDNLTKAFKYHLELNAGLKLDFGVLIKFGKAGYQINKAEVVDEEAFMLWMLTWS